MVGRDRKRVKVRCRDRISPSMVDGYPLQRVIYAYFRDEPDGDAKAFVKWLQTSAAITTWK